MSRTAHSPRFRATRGAGVRCTGDTTVCEPDWTPDSMRERSPRAAFSRVLAPVLVVALSGAGVACSGNGPELAGPTTTATPTVTEVPATSEQVSTSGAPSPSETPSVTVGAGAPSAGVIVADGHDFDLAVTCHQAASGLVALGRGVHPESRAEVAAVVQVAPGEPYVGVVVDGTEGVRYEAALDAPLELTFDGERIRSGTVEFVADLDLATGEGDPVGVGRVDLRCDEVLDGLPDGWVTDSREARPGEDVPSGTR